MQMRIYRTPALKVLNHIEVELQDFKVDHNKLLMLLRLSEYKNWKFQMLVTLAMVVRFSKNLVRCDQEKKFYKPIKFQENLRGWVAWIT